MSITTKRGDKGATRIGSGESLSKSNPVVEALGTLDELQCALGVARASCGDRVLGEEIRALQAKLFSVGGLIAGVESCQDSITDDDVNELTARCAALEKECELPTGFVLSGDSVVSAQLDVARSTARRLERRLVALADEGELDSSRLFAWINRLSDYLWLLARIEESGQGLKPTENPR